MISTLYVHRKQFKGNTQQKMLTVGTSDWIANNLITYDVK